MKNYQVVFDPKQALHYRSTVYEEMPTFHLRWLKKKSGEKVLQEEFAIKEAMSEKVEYKWKDIEEVEEE